mgnify:CR=1 FL=1
MYKRRYKHCLKLKHSNKEKTNNNTLLKELYPYFRYLKEYDKTSFPDVMYLDELFEKNSYKKI